MYETQFGLHKRPFRSLATGSDVFVGPQTAAAMAGLKKALASPDAVVAVGGPVGVGKTTLVHRALDAIGDNPVIITVGRMHLDNDEVLELLLEETGVDIPPGTVQRFTRFRRQLKHYADGGSRVFVVVEDAARVGADALSELEALTATDAGVSEGASIVLMGDEGLEAALQNPQLARLRQRLRSRQSIAPLSSAELLGYMKHCFRLAGNEFDQVFENGSADVLHRLSEGIPRVANNLVESSLISAAENKLDRVNVAQIKLVASEEYGLSVAGLSEPPAASPTETKVAKPATSKPEMRPKPQPAAAPPAPPAAKPDPAPAPSASTESPPAQPAEDEIPDLIQDTLPDLEILAPDLARAAEQQPVQRTVQPKAEPQPPVLEPQPEQAPAVSKEPEPPVLEPQPEQAPVVHREPEPPVLEPQPEQAPAVSKEPEPPVIEPQLEQMPAAGQEPEPAAAPPLADDEVPEWDRDPTLAQLRPDLDALEQALAVDEGNAPAPEVEVPASKPAAEEETPELVPEITLDRRIQAKVDEAAEQIRQEKERRAEAEAEKQKKEESDVDNRTTAEILADAGVRNPDPIPAPDNSAKAQVEVAPPKPEVPVSTEDLHATTDTIHELPVLWDATEPAFEPAKHRKPEPAPAPKPVPAPEAKPAPTNEIELELELDQKAASKPEPSPEELENARKADAELEQIASNLARAKTIDDCDDKMAETLFGEEFSMMAAQVAASAPPELFGDDEAQAPEPPQQAQAIDEPQQPEESANDEVADPAFAAMQDFDGVPAVNVELEADSIRTGSTDTSASQRLQTVRALNAGAPGASAAGSPGAESAAPRPPVDQPQSIEDQINTSMTQTLKTLSVPPVANDDDNNDGKSKGGFFSRFRR